jgi:hypothetical protein
MSKAGLGYVVGGTIVGALTGLVGGLSWELTAPDVLPDPGASPAYCWDATPSGVPAQPCAGGFVCAPGLLRGACVEPAVASSERAKDLARVLGPAVGGALLAYLAIARPWEP